MGHWHRVFFLGRTHLPENFGTDARSVCYERKGETDPGDVGAGARLSENIDYVRRPMGRGIRVVIVGLKHLRAQAGIVSRIVFYERNGATYPTDGETWNLVGCKYQLGEKFPGRCDSCVIGMV